MSLFRKRLWPLGQAAKTAPSHGAIMGSIPVGVIKKNKSTRWVLLFFCSEGIEGAEVNDSLRRLSEPRRPSGIVPRESIPVG